MSGPSARDSIDPGSEPPSFERGWQAGTRGPRGRLIIVRAREPGLGWAVRIGGIGNEGALRRVGGISNCGVRWGWCWGRSRGWKRDGADGVVRSNRGRLPERRALSRGGGERSGQPSRARPVTQALPFDSPSPSPAEQVRLTPSFAYCTCCNSLTRLALTPGNPPEAP